jgi:hypothetical protein
VAGQNIGYQITFTDDFGNPAVLTKSYVAWRVPFYSPADQNLALVQVSVTQILKPAIELIIWMIL